MTSRRKALQCDDPSPVEISEHGIPVGPSSLRFVYALSSLVKHCDTFSPLYTWSQHKKAGRVQKLWNEMKGPWGLPEREETKGWFNKRANQMWADHITKVLKPYYAAAKGDFQKAIEYRPTALIDEESWKLLCKKIEKMDAPGEGPDGKSKSQKCKISRSCNNMNHCLGRTSLESWGDKHFKLFGRLPTPREFFSKTYMRIDSTESIDSSSQSDQPDESGVARRVSMYPQASSTLEALNSAYSEAITQGLDEQQADAIAIQNVLGESSRLASVLNTQKKAKFTATRVRNSSQQHNELEALKLELEEERATRRAIQENLRVHTEMLKQVFAHLGVESLESLSSNDTDILASDPTV